MKALGVTCVVLALCPANAPHAQTVAHRAVVCTSIGLDHERTWTFEPQQDTWRVTHSTAGQSHRATLRLPNATASFGDTVSLRARTANGGIDVTLSGSWQRATLDAYVNYELEVNVDVSLTPDIDEISTDAPTGVQCARIP
jgi:hypothetical protein